MVFNFYIRMMLCNNNNSLSLWCTIQILWTYLRFYQAPKYGYDFPLFTDRLVNLCANEMGRIRFQAFHDRHSQTSFLVTCTGWKQSYLLGLAFLSFRPVDSKQYLTFVLLLEVMQKAVSQSNRNFAQNQFL